MISVEEEAALGTLGELLKVSPEKFNVMVKNMPQAEKPDLLDFLLKRYSLVLALR